MEKLVRNIGNIRLNGYGADIYENEDGSAVIKFDRYCESLPDYKFRHFTSLEAVEDWLESLNYVEVYDGANLLNSVLRNVGIYPFGLEDYETDNGFYEEFDVEFYDEMLERVENIYD
jgi:hypothetical protein